MRKMLSVIMTIILLTLVGGCQSEPSKSYTLINHQFDPITPTPLTTPLSSQVNLGYPEEQYAVSLSNGIEGWEELEAKVFLNEMTYQRDQRVLSPMEENIMVEYSIKFPDSWTLSRTVFNKDTQKKIAELIPVYLLEPDDKSDFTTFEIPEEYSEAELLSKEMVTFGEYEGFKIILKVSNTETWYPHTYYLTDGTYVFGISLYSYSEKRDEAEQQLFDDIVSSFSFKRTEAQTEGQGHLLV